MSNKIGSRDIEKAAVTACLFFFIAISGLSQDFKFSPALSNTYQKLLQLDFSSTRPAGNSPEERYLTVLGETISLLLSEDVAQLESWEDLVERELDYDATTPQEHLVTAEVHLQACFVYLKFGREFDAALQLRKAHRQISKLRKDHPNFLAPLKTSGLLNVMLASVPEKYHWLLSVLDMRGDIKIGLSELARASSRENVLAAEAGLWNAFVIGYVLQDPARALAHLDANPDTTAIARFLKVNLRSKNGQSALALLELDLLKSSLAGRDVSYLHYLEGELLLHKGDYTSALSAYEKFLSSYKGRNFVKDAWYKKGICFWILEDPAQAKLAFAEARSAGIENTEADKHAARALREDPGVIPLIQLRYFTDGGYYQKALEIVNNFEENTLNTLKEQVEFAYRKARLYHRLGDLPKAILLYHSTIQKAKENDWYYAPNSCLQLGYIAVEAGRISEAKGFFEKAIAYRRHEYKNSIDTKARSALGQLKARK